MARSTDLQKYLRIQKHSDLSNLSSELPKILIKDHHEEVIPKTENISNALEKYTKWLSSRLKSKNLSKSSSKLKSFQPELKEKDSRASAGAKSKIHGTILQVEIKKTSALLLKYKEK